ncbi:hypothetical protein EYW49_10620 [Siculibacillus lacustris]|uniref:Lipoprotein n=1 Tax=Siculibacillus lacustris TaxID=1549641 RepID=A0A4V2KTN5_9HYPH|nr:hypothetical protein [Siculibacillus lacustris]TBW38045.1 hypothetical protein EYW49_10620 [Siculibacillus lacustris]
MSRLTSAAAAAVLALGLSACSLVPDWDHRYGPGPVLSDTDIDARLARQKNVMNRLYLEAETYGSKTALRNRWYDATLLGFNYADEDCGEYLRLNFRLARMRERDHGLLTHVGGGLPGLLSATTVPAAATTTIAAAFGMGATVTDDLLSSYLFTNMDPSVVFRTVTRLQNSYRNETLKRKAEIDSGATAYRAVQNYYSLCFPQTIEAKMSEFLASANVETVNPDGTPTASTPADKGTAKPKTTDQAAASNPGTIEPKLTSKTP